MRTEELLRELVHGRWKAQALAAAVRLDLAGTLADGALPVRELAARVEADEDALRRLLRLMVELGIFAGDAGDVYRNDEASQLLRADRPDSLRRYALKTLSTRYASDSRIE
jgi:C-methyltransferase